MKFQLRHIGWPKHVRAHGGWLGSEELMKDVAACDKSRGGGKQPVIREFPNGATHRDEVAISNAEYIGVEKGTWGSETSQYPEEKKKTTLTPYLLPYL